MATCNLNVIVVLDFISRDLYLLFAILFSSKFQNSIFYQHMRPKSGLKSSRPFIHIFFMKKFDPHFYVRVMPLFIAMSL